MTYSYPRYLFRLFLVAAAVNTIFSTVGAAVAFPPSRPVPTFGNPSVASDTLVSSFFIGFFSFVGVFLAARQDARAGRVRGLGWVSSPWTARRIIGGAFLLGALVVVAFGVPVTRALASRHHAEMVWWTFLLFKVAFADVSGILATLVAAICGVASERPVGTEARWDRSGAHGNGSYPFDFLDKACFGVSVERRRGCSNTLLWDLPIAGFVEPSHVARALEDLVCRYPILKTKVRAVDGVPPFASKYRYVPAPSFGVHAILDVLDVRNDPAQGDAVHRELRSRHLDLFSEFPVQFVLLLTSEASCRLLVRQHHAIADGRAFFALLHDFAKFLEHARRGEPPPVDMIAPVPRRAELDAIEFVGVGRVMATLQGFGIILMETIKSIVRPIRPLPQNQSQDYSGENDAIFWEAPADILECWRAVRDRVGVSLNSILAGAFFLANKRWSLAQRYSPGRTCAQLIMETRPRAKEFVSFANHLTFLNVEADLGREWTPERLVAHVQVQSDRQRRSRVPFKRQLAERVLVLPMPLDQLERVIFDAPRAAFNLNFSNVIAIDFPALKGDGWLVETVRITVPVAPRHGIVLTIIRYGDKLVFGLSFKATAIARDQVDALGAEFRKCLDEVMGIDAGRAHVPSVLADKSDVARCA